MSSAGVLLGLDIGGTKIGLSVGTLGGQVLASDRLAFDHQARPEALLQDCLSRLDRLRAGRGNVLALGAACPGPIDYAQGRFINPPNNPSLHGFALRDWMAANMSWPSVMMNDANAAAYAEWLWGAARGSQTAVFLTFSTGMGSGLIIDGRLYEGPSGLAGEIGRMKLSPGDDGPVGFGRRGSVEGYCSGPGMAQLAVSEAIICTQTGEASVLRQLYADTKAITPEQLCEAARAGDAAARRVTMRVAEELGRLMAIMTDILNPQVFVLGTIGTAFPELFIPVATKTLRAMAIPEAAASVDVRPSSLPDRGHQQALAAAVHALGTTKPSGNDGR